MKLETEFTNEDFDDAIFWGTFVQAVFWGCLLIFMILLSISCNDRGSKENTDRATKPDSTLVDSTDIQRPIGK